VKMDLHGSAVQIQRKSRTHGHSVASKDTRWVAHIMYIYKQILQFFRARVHAMYCSSACECIDIEVHSESVRSALEHCVKMTFALSK
jgi:hypothetical protein